LKGVKGRWDDEKDSPVAALRTFKRGIVSKTIIPGTKRSVRGEKNEDIATKGEALRLDRVS